MAEPTPLVFEDAQWIDWPIPTKGMSRDVDPEVMPADFWAVATNVFSEYGVTKKSHGWEAIQAAAADLDLGDPVMLVAEVEDSARFPHTIFATHERIWVYDGDNDILTPINRYDEGTIAVTNGDLSVVGTGTLFLKFVKRGDKVVVGGSSATVQAVDSDTEITLAETWPGGTDAAVDLSDAANYIEQLFSINGIWDWTVFQGGGSQPHIYMTNGIDAVIRYGGDGSHTHVEILGGDPPKAYFIQSFREFLVLGYLTDNGAGIALPYSIGWPVAGQPENWAGGEQRTLAEGVDALVGMEVLGNRLVLHREESQSFMEFRGGTFTFFTGEINRGAGGVGKRSVTRIKNGHLVVGDENIFIHSTQDLHHIGSMTIQQYLVENIHPEFADTVQGLYVPNENRVYIFYPSLVVAGNFCDKCLVFNTLEGSFTEIDAPSVTSTGHYREYEKTFINDVTDIINTVLTLIDAQTPLTFLDTFAVGSTDGKVYTLTGLNDFDGTEIVTTLESGQEIFAAPNNRKNITRIRVDLEAAVGTVVNLFLGHKNEAFKDFTWAGPFVIPITGVDDFVLPNNINARYFARRFVVGGTDSSFTLRKMQVYRSIEGEY